MAVPHRVNYEVSDRNTSPFRSLAFLDPEGDISTMDIGSIANNSFAQLDMDFSELFGCLDEDKEVESYTTQLLSNANVSFDRESMPASSLCPSAPSYSRPSSFNASPFPDVNFSLHCPLVPNPTLTCRPPPDTDLLFASACPLVQRPPPQTVLPTYRSLSTSEQPWICQGADLEHSLHNGAPIASFGGGFSAFQPPNTSLQTAAHASSWSSSQQPLPALETCYPTRTPVATQYSPVSPFPRPQSSVTLTQTQTQTQRQVDSGEAVTRPSPSDACTTKDLVKGRLKQRIIQRGEDPRLEPSKPAPPVITPEAERNREKRRERNRDAARRTRHHKLEHVTKLEEQVAVSAEEIAQLEAQCKRLKTEMRQLQNKCKGHLICVKNCPHDAQIRQVLGKAFAHAAADTATATPTAKGQDESSSDESPD